MNRRIAIVARAARTRRRAFAMSDRASSTTSSSAAAPRAACSPIASPPTARSACCCSKPARAIATCGSTCPSGTRRRCSTRSTTGVTTPTPTRACTIGASTGRAAAASAARRRSTGSSTCAGSPRTTTRWAAGGNRGWGWRDVLPYFVRSEGNQRGASATHGADGPLACSDIGERHELIEAIIAGAGQLGVPRTDDFNGGVQEGVGYYQLFTKNGLRCSTAVGYLRPARGRPNLTVRTDAQATRVVCEGRRAVGVEYRHGGTLHTATRGGRSGARGGRAAEPATAAALGHRSAGSAREVRRPRRACAAGRRREPAGPPAAAPAVPLHQADHDQRRSQLVVAIVRDRPQVHPHAARTAGGGHQPGRPVHAGDAGLRPRPTSSSTSRRCPPTWRGPSRIRFRVSRSACASCGPRRAATCASRRPIRSRRRRCSRTTCPRPRTAPARSRRCASRARSPATPAMRPTCGGIAAGSGRAERRRAARVRAPVRRDDLPPVGHVQDGTGERSAGGRRRPAARARRGGIARGRLLDHAHARVRQYECAGGDDRGEGERPDARGRRA